jgi:plasmid stabilization system protein ParE
MRILWLPEALVDLERLYDFLVERDPAAAERVIRTIEDGADRLGELPERGRAMDDDTGRRELVVPFGAGAYVLRYRLQQDTGVILRVWHSREGRV